MTGPDRAHLRPDALEKYEGRFVDDARILQGQLVQALA